MAVEYNYSLERDGALFIGKDFRFILKVLNDDQDEAIDISSWALAFMVKRKATDPDANALIDKTTANGGLAVSGTYNSDPDVSTQEATATVLSADTDDHFRGICYYEWARTDTGFKVPLQYGTVPLARSVIHG